MVQVKQASIHIMYISLSTIHCLFLLQSVAEVTVASGNVDVEDKLVVAGYDVKVMECSATHLL